MILSKTIIKINKKSLEWFIKDFQINNIKFGDLVYDTYVRNYNKYTNPKVDLIFILILFKTIFRVLNLKQNLFNKNIKVLITGTTSYSTNGAIATRLAIKNKIKVIEPYFYGYVEINNNTINKGYFNQENKRNKKKIKKISSKTANKYFIKKFYKHVSGNYTGRKDIFYSNKYKILKEVKKSDLFKMLNLKNFDFKKIILIASHAFSDSPHALGRDLLFNDYYQFLVETLNHLNNNNNKSILWLIKPHPSSWYYGEEGIVEKLIENLNCENVKLFPKKLNTANALNLCDAVVTARGTIGMEFACFGKLALTVGAAPYSSLNIAKNFKTKKEYFKYMDNMNLTKKIEEDKKILARKLVYFLENRKKNFLKSSKIFDTKVLKKFNSFNPVIRFKDHHIINNQLNKNLKKFKIKNDDFYKDLLNKINIY